LNSSDEDLNLGGESGSGNIEARCKGALVNSSNIEFFYITGEDTSRVSGYRSRSSGFGKFNIESFFTSNGSCDSSIC